TLLKRHPKLFHDAERRLVIGLDHGDQARKAPPSKTVLHDRRGRFGSESLSPVLWSQTPADFDLRSDAVPESAEADQFGVLAVDNRPENPAPLPADFNPVGDARLDLLVGP